jgi:hypothetical protein
MPDYLGGLQSALLNQDAINSAGLPRSLRVDFRENISSTV